MTGKEKEKKGHVQGRAAVFQRLRKRFLPA